MKPQRTTPSAPWTFALLTIVIFASSTGCLLDRSGLAPGPLAPQLINGCFELWDEDARTGAAIFESASEVVTAGRGRGVIPDLVVTQTPWTFAQTDRVTTAGDIISLSLTGSGLDPENPVQARILDTGFLRLSSTGYSVELPPCQDLVALFDRDRGLLTFWRAHFETPGEASLPFDAFGSDLLPLAGDWDGDGDDQPGIYVPGSRVFFLPFGENRLTINAPDLPVGETLLPIAGDWDGDGRDSPGLYAAESALFVLLDEGGNQVAAFNQGRFDPAAPLGLWPIAGNWRGDASGIDTVGLYNRSARRVRLFDRNDAAATATACTFDTAPESVVQGLLPTAGRFSGASQDRVMLYGPGLEGGPPGNSLTLVEVPPDPAGCAVVDRITLGPTPLDSGLIPVAGNWSGTLTGDGP
ncbi:MAG: hypothetical protein AAGD01_17110 [Acidobacteriota bacterium]